MVKDYLGASGCLRDEYGHWILGFSKFLGRGNALQAELWAIMIGLQLTTQHQPHPKLEIETDSTQVIQLLVENLSNVHPFHSLIINCKFLISSLSDFI